jgi:hypothetical protein
MGWLAFWTWEMSPFSFVPLSLFLVFYFFDPSPRLSSFLTNYLYVFTLLFFPKFYSSFSPYPLQASFLPFAAVLLSHHQAEPEQQLPEPRRAVPHINPIDLAPCAARHAGLGEATGPFCTAFCFCQEVCSAGPLSSRERRWLAGEPQLTGFPTPVCSSFSTRVKFPGAAGSASGRFHPSSLCCCEELSRKEESRYGA